MGWVPVPTVFTEVDLSQNSHGLWNQVTRTQIPQSLISCVTLDKPLRSFNHQFPLLPSGCDGAYMSNLHPLQ